MAEWPELEEAKQVLDITSDDWDDRVASVLAASIMQVKEDIGDWDEYEDFPDDKLSRAAMRLLDLIWTTPGTDIGTFSLDPTYQALLKGRRRKFAIG